MFKGFVMQAVHLADMKSEGIGNGCPVLESQVAEFQDDPFPGIRHPADGLHDVCLEFDQAVDGFIHFLFHIHHAGNGFFQPVRVGRPARRHRAECR